MTASAREERPQEHGLTGSRDRIADEQSVPERERFFELSVDLLCTIGSDGKFGLVNPAFRELLGYELADLVCRPAVDYIHPDDIASTLAAREQLAPGDSQRFENRVRCRDGSYKRLSWCATRDESKDGARVPLVEYVGGLTDNIFRATASCEGKLTLELTIEPVSLAMDKAMTCGLLLNELITNAVKHGFPDGRAGIIRLELYCRDGQVRLVLSDDGVGLAVDLDVEQSPSLGVRLIRTFAQQLEATIEFKRERGTAVRVAFAA